ncbi:MAG: dihydrolipoamide acetyltransferase family protein [bacterium]|nr:dihydrolipoamide acetyltransferase family protein [bacterium]
MAIEIKMPQLSDTMDQGTILTWLIQEGETVERGDALAEVATDKADLEIESFHDGKLLKVLAPVGAKVKVGEVIALIGEAGEVAGESVASAKSQVTEVVQPAAPVVAASSSVSSFSSEIPVASAVKADESERLRISPLARNLAQVTGVDVTGINGSGEGGRIVKRDVEAVAGNVKQVAVAPASPAPITRSSVSAAPAATSVSSAAPVVSASAAASNEPLSRMRSAIAALMVESKTTIPHFQMTTRVMVDELMALRNTLKSLPQYEGITFNHLLLKAVALALRAVPRINAHYKDGSLVQPADINIGIVTALDDGLLIPVLKSVDTLSLSDVVGEAKGLVQRARSGRPKPTDLVGATFSVSNVGNLQVESFSAIISPGQGAILAVGAIQDEAVVVGGTLKAAKVMRLTVSVDHRIIDGVVGGQFLTELNRILSNPVLILA